MSNARIALFGGTFDPIHNAHLAIARAAADSFGLAKVLFVPAASPPHKSTQETAPYEDRLHMVQLACADDPRFEASRIEQPDPDHPHAANYSINTIEKLHALGYGPLSFLIGADAFAEITTWHRWRELIAEVDFIVVTRPGAAYACPPGARVRELTGIASSVSSSSVRADIANGSQPIAIPDPVLSYIREHGLYGSQT